MAEETTEVWQLFYTEEGAPYYFNNVTLESSWDDPTLDIDHQSINTEAAQDAQNFEHNNNDNNNDNNNNDNNHNYSQDLSSVSTSLDQTMNTEAAVNSNQTFDQSFASSVLPPTRAWQAEEQYSNLNTNSNANANSKSNPPKLIPNNSPLNTQQQSVKAKDIEETLEELHWMRYETENGGNPYYYNWDSGETQWTLPEEVETHINTKQLSRPNSALSQSINSRSGTPNPSIAVSNANAANDDFQMSSLSNNRSTSPKEVSFSPIIQNQNQNQNNAAYNSPVMKQSDLDNENDFQKSTANRKSTFSPILLDKIRKRFRAASYATSGMDWEQVFKRYDKSGDNMLDQTEFFEALRKGLKISSRDVSDRDIDVLMHELDLDDNGAIDLVEFASFLHDDEKERVRDSTNAKLRRSIVGLKPAESKSDFSASKMNTWELSDGNYDRAKKAHEELLLQRRARQLALSKKNASSDDAKKSAEMAHKIMAVKPMNERLEKRFSARGRRKGDKAWTKTAYRVKVAHSAQILWRDAEIRQAAYGSLLSNFKPDLTLFMTGAVQAHKRNKRSKVTPLILEQIRKKFKADSYTTKGSDLVKLFNKYDDRRAGFIDFQRFREIIRKNCKLGKNQLTDYDVLEIFETLSGLDESREEKEGVDKNKPPPIDKVVESEEDGIDLDHFLRFVRTDVPASLSLTNGAPGKVTHGEILMYIIDKNKKRLREAAIKMGISEWTDIFALYDSDGNGALSYNEFLKIFRVDLKLSAKEMKEAEAKFIFEFIDADLSGGISADEFRLFLHSGRQERGFPIQNSGDGHLEGGNNHEFESHKFVQAKEKEVLKDHVEAVVEKVRAKFRAYSYSVGGQNFSKIFDQIDKSHDGAIDENEFRIAVRKLLKVPPLVLSDKDLKAFFGELSGRVEMNSDNSLDKDAFVKFIAGAAEEDGGGPGNGNGEWNGYVDEEAILKENVKRIKFKINSQVGKLAGIGGKDLRDVFFSMDVDGSGTISLNELCKGLRTVLKISEREIGRNDVLGVFKALDRNGDGVLSLEEFMEFLEKKEM